MIIIKSQGPKRPKNYVRVLDQPHGFEDKKSPWFIEARERQGNKTDINKTECVPTAELFCSVFSFSGELASTGFYFSPNI